eukprot:4344084-Pleurochrysis_carterae.AAC.5
MGPRDQEGLFCFVLNADQLCVHIYMWSNQSQGRLRKVKQGESASKCRSLLGAKLKTVKHHIMYDSTQMSAACEESTFKVRKGCVSLGAAPDEEKPKVRGSRKNLTEVLQKEVVLHAKKAISREKEVQPSTRESRKSEKAEKSLRGAEERGGENGDRGGREKTKYLDGAGDVCARGSVATVYARQAGRLLKRRRRSKVERGPSRSLGLTLSNYAHLSSRVLYLLILYRDIPERPSGPCGRR